MFDIFLNALENCDDKAGEYELNEININCKLFDFGEEGLPDGKPKPDIFLPATNTYIETKNCGFYIVQEDQETDPYFKNRFWYYLIRRENNDLGGTISMYRGNIDCNSKGNIVMNILGMWSDIVNNFGRNILAEKISEMAHDQYNKNENIKEAVANGKRTKESAINFIKRVWLVDEEWLNEWQTKKEITLKMKKRIYGNNESYDDVLYGTLHGIMDSIFGNLLLIEKIMSPDYFIIERTSTKRHKNKFKRALRKHQRPNYTILKLKDIRVRYKLAQENIGTGKKLDSAVYRKSHPRTYTHQRYIFKRGQTVIIEGYWVGPKETIIGTKRYKVIIDKNDWSKVC